MPEGLVGAMMFEFKFPNGLFNQKCNKIVGTSFDPYSFQSNRAVKQKRQEQGLKF
jgi:hypothetical protein